MQNTMTPTPTWGNNPNTNPDPAIANVERERQSKLLARTSIIALVMISIVNGISLYQDIVRNQFPLEMIFLTPMSIMLVVVYFVNRASYYKAGTYLFMGAGYAVLTTFAAQDYSVLIYFSILVLIGSMFLSSREIQILSVIVFLTVVTLILQVETVNRLVTPLYAFNFTIVSLPLLIVNIQHRKRIEKERLQKLSEANAALRESEAKLEQRVLERTTELAQAKTETEAALEKALEADQLKSQFLASMSHELRTPLNSILTFTELMQMGTFGDVNDEQVDYLGKTLHSGRHLLSLINDVLDITKIQAGMMKLFIEDDFNVKAEIDNVVAAAEQMLKDKPVQLFVDIDNDFPTMTCDKRRVRQILLNLTSNAVKFTEEGSITLSAKKRENDILFAIIDTGPGIAKDEHHLIFEPFVQTETGIKHAGGTGLGLPISRRMAQAHGGDLWVDSDAGEGAAFYFTLPLETHLQVGEKEMK